MLKIFPNGIELDETTVQLLEWRVPDIETWVADALKGHINHCKLEFEKEWIPKLQADPTVESIPSRIDAFVKTVTSRVDYKNRKQRDAEAQMQATSQFAEK